MFKIKQQYRGKNISKCSEGNPRRNIRFLHWILRLPVMMCCGYLVVSESCPLLSLCYLPTRHTQLDKCFVWPSKFVFLPLNCDFISLGQTRRCVCVCFWMCVQPFPPICLFENGGEKTKNISSKIGSIPDCLQIISISSWFKKKKITLNKYVSWNDF